MYFYVAELRIIVKGFPLESPKFTAVLLAPAYVSSISFSPVQSPALELSTEAREEPSKVNRRHCAQRFAGLRKWSFVA